MIRYEDSFLLVASFLIDRLATPAGCAGNDYPTKSIYPQESSPPETIGYLCASF